MRTLIIIMMTMMMAGTVAMAQSDAESDVPRVRFFHQVFLDDTVQSVEKVVYNDDSCAIEFKLSDDKTALYLIDYDGKRSIHAYYTDKTGLPKDIKKPHCQVMDLRMEL